MKSPWRRLSTRERRLVVLTLFIFFLVLGRYFLVSPFMERGQWVKSQLEMQPQLLEKNLRYISQKAEIEARLEQAQNELKAFEPLLFSGDTPQVNASDLQQTVQGLAAKEGTQIITTRVLNPEPMSAFTKIPIQVEVSGQIDQVVNLIKGIEAAEKLLVLDELNVRSIFTPAVAARQQGLPQTQAQNLRVSLVISGFARTQTGATSKGAPASAKAKSEEGKGTQSGPRR